MCSSERIASGQAADALLSMLFIYRIYLPCTNNQMLIKAPPPNGAPKFLVLLPDFVRGVNCEIRGAFLPRQDLFIISLVARNSGGSCSRFLSISAASLWWREEGGCRNYLDREAIISPTGLLSSYFLQPLHSQSGQVLMSSKSIWYNIH